MLIYVIITPKQGERFTEFYILGEKGMAADYPTFLRVNETSKVIVGIINHEYALTNYTLVLLQRAVALEHNSTWEEKVFFTPIITDDNLKLEFLLYKEGNFTAPYRDLHLWVKVI
jgi:uncharacterized membrane protein